MPKVTADVREVIQMMNGEFARVRIEDRVREADAYRVSRSTRARRVAATHGKARKVGAGVLSALLWPIKH